MLYVVGTPIGNLQDLSLNQALILSSADIILSEDTRRTGILLTQIQKLFHLNINPKLIQIPYYKEVEFEKLPYILKLLSEEKKVVLISSAGMPLISDPGSLLVNHVIKQSLPFKVIPGPVAYVSALIYSGFNTQNSLFLGFLPKKKSQIRTLLTHITTLKKTMDDLVFIAYESPVRIQKTLLVFHEFIPQASVVICRELTKHFEEIVRGNPKELSGKSYKGELVLVFS